MLLYADVQPREVCLLAFDVRQQLLLLHHPLLLLSDADLHSTLQRLQPLGVHRVEALAGKDREGEVSSRRRSKRGWGQMMGVSAITLSCADRGRFAGRGEASDGVLASVGPGGPSGKKDIVTALEQTRADAAEV